MRRVRGPATRGGGVAGAFAHLVRQTQALHEVNDGAANRRKALAEFCRLMGREVRAHVPAAAIVQDERSRSLSPRLRQTLEHLLQGDGEKQIAAKLQLSKHTVHVYVKALHRHYSVCSRSELLALFVTRPGF